MKTKKKYRALPYPDLSFQFCKDAHGTPKFVVTSNPSKDGKDFCTGIDKYIFADNLIDSSTCSINELVFLCSFFEIVRSKLEAKVRKA